MWHLGTLIAMNEKADEVIRHNEHELKADTEVIAGQTVEGYRCVNRCKAFCRTIKAFDRFGCITPRPRLVTARQNS